MATYITDLDVSTTETEEKKLQSQGFKKISLNGNNINLWYKIAKDPEHKPAITRIQLTFNAEMAVGLNNAGYMPINKNLNAGPCGDCIYLWYYRGNTKYDTPIVAIEVTTNAKDEGAKFGLGFERMGCHLNRGSQGAWTYIWVKREKHTYICDLIATSSFGSDTDYFNQGYIRVDEDTNRGSGGAYVFIWYRQTTSTRPALSDLTVSTNPREYQNLQDQKYKLVDTDLNQGTPDDQVYMWYKQENSSPIKTIVLLLNPDAVPVYMRDGVNVIERSLNRSCPKNEIEYLCFYQ